MSTLGHNIAYLRKIKGITQENLAEMLQVSAQAVSKWENNISCPDILLLKPIANLFGVTVDQLLSAEEPKNLKNIQVANKILRIDFIDSQDNISLDIPLENLDELSKTEKVKNKPFLNSESGLLKKINFAWLKEYIDSGNCGTFLQMKSEDGTEVKISIE